MKHALIMHTETFSTKDNTAAQWGRFERLRPAQIESIKTGTPLAYIPWGALEWHSYHNPIGLDGMQALGQCCALAEGTGGVVLPPVYVGTDTIKPFKGFPHSIEHRAATVSTLCREYLDQLAEEGFRVVVVVTGHCGGAHVAALSEAVEAFSEAQSNTTAVLIPSFEPIQDVYPSNHAARGETSLQLLFDPGLVDLSRLPEDRPVTLDRDGVWGDDPRAASASEGSVMLAVFVERTVPIIRELMKRNAK
jgi:creatinine amidohydrolase